MHVEENRQCSDSLHLSLAFTLCLLRASKFTRANFSETPKDETLVDTHRCLESPDLELLMLSMEISFPCFPFEIVLVIFSLAPIITAVLGSCNDKQLLFIIFNKFQGWKKVVLTKQALSQVK